MLRTYQDSDWLLKAEPRLVQIEALSRSYYGVALRDNPNEEARPRLLPGRTNATKRGWGHFMEPRCGKTYTLLNEFLMFRRDRGFKNLIVFAPNSFKPTWVIEADKVGMPMPAYYWDPDDRKNCFDFLTKNSEYMFAVNYEATRSEDLMQFLLGATDGKTMVAADESVWLKGHNSAISKAVRRLGASAGATRILSGKPIIQAPFDLWGQFEFLGVNGGDPFFAFKNRFCDMGGFQNKKVIGIKNEDRFRQLREAHSFFARKATWLDVPGVEYTKTRMDMLPEQRKLYRQMEEDFIATVSLDTIVEADQVTSKLTKMQQISSGFIYDQESKVHQVVPFDKTPMAQELLRFMQEELTGKVLVMAHYRHTVDSLVKLLAPYGVVCIRGNMGGAETQDQKARFNGDPNVKAMVCQLKAVKYGHTLMGSEDMPCLDVLYFENSYSLDDRAQSEERPQGAGQRGLVTIRDYYCSPIQRRAIEALQRKEEVAATLMGYVTSMFSGGASAAE